MEIFHENPPWPRVTDYFVQLRGVYAILCHKTRSGIVYGIVFTTLERTCQEGTQIVTVGS